MYLGCCGSEVHALWLGDVNNITGYEQTGCTMSMFANRLSFTYDFKGPSKAIDTGATAMAKTCWKAPVRFRAICETMLKAQSCVSFGDMDVPLPRLCIPHLAA